MKVVLWGFIVWYCFSYPLLYFEMLEPFYAVISHSSGIFFFFISDAWSFINMDDWESDAYIHY